MIRLEDDVDVAGSLEFIRRSGDDLLDRWDGQHLLRTVRRNGRSMAFGITFSKSNAGLQLSVEMDGDRDPNIVVEAASRTFAPLPTSFSSLLSRDRVLASLHARFPSLRPVLQHDVLLALVRSISAQQVNLRWAATIRARLAETYGLQHEVGAKTVYSLSASRLAEAQPSELRRLQLTMRKAESVIGVAQDVAAGRLEVAALQDMDDQEVIERLTCLKGIGLWSAEWFLCRTLGRPRVAAGDLGVRKAVGRAYLDGAMPSEQQVREIAMDWGESASIAQTLLLHGLALGS
ncbi:MAG TPA: hypothetical protein VFB34_08160 [Chloroflexota bacterium]|nr:hypothetical protein [Chloroflexota bacterium]